MYKRDVFSTRLAKAVVYRALIFPKSTSSGPQNHRIFPYKI